MEEVRRVQVRQPGRVHLYGVGELALFCGLQPVGTLWQSDKWTKPTKDCPECLKERERRDRAKL